MINKTIALFVQSYSAQMLWNIQIRPMNRYPLLKSTNLPDDIKIEASDFHLNEYVNLKLFKITPTYRTSYLQVTSKYIKISHTNSLNRNCRIFLGTFENTTSRPSYMVKIHNVYSNFMKSLLFQRASRKPPT